MMKILILGAGAVGGYFGGRLVEYQQKGDADFEVTFLVRQGRAEQIRTDGLRLRHPDASITVIRNVDTIVSPDDASAGGRREFDVIVLACKSYGLTGALDAVAPYVRRPGTAIVPLLNGMAHLATIRERFPSAVVWGGTCGIVAALDPDSGLIRRMTPSQFVLAGLLKQEDSKASNADLNAFIRHLQGAGIEAGVSDDIVQAMWDKWTFLATAAAATCLMGATIGEILATDHGQDLLLGLFHECNAVATAEGGLPADLDGRQARLYRSITDKTSIVKASMCRDMEGGGPTEADHVIGDMIRRAMQHGIATPSLRTAYTRLQIYEARRRADATTTDNPM